VGLRTPTVVRLVGALAHVRNSVFVLRPRGIDSENATLPERGRATARPYAGHKQWSIILPVGTATRWSVPRRHWSFCATGESFAARQRLPEWASVEGMAAPLLACPFAGLQQCSQTTLDRPKLDKAVNRSAR
jgi:hypothetical protein